ncbi:hypothetical protein TNCV_297341 [Trichonephila clavipes]|nr:hypothetical protein TNCV_297341 [Trichonephila clavipes]
MQSKGRPRLDTGRKDQSLQNDCRLFARKFFFQTQQQDHELAEEPLSAYVVMRLIPSTDLVLISMPYADIAIVVASGSPKQAPMLTAVHQQRRLEFSYRYRNWASNERRQVEFSD